MALDVRIVASTNRDLDAAVRAGAFRADLLHRLAVVVVRLPPLRERATDVPLIVEHALSRRPGPRRRFAPDALDALAARPWPGNVRELLNVVERACLLSDADPLEPADLGDESLERQAGDPAAVAENLRRRILDEGGSFWEIVRGPYLRRELPRDAVRLFIERAWLDSGRSYKEMARRLGIEKDHKKLLNFLWTQDLGVTRDEE